MNRSLVELSRLKFTFGFCIMILYSLLQGVSNVYIGGISGDLHHFDHLPITVITSLTSYLFLGNGLGCLLGSTLVDHYGAGTVSTLFCLLAAIGYWLFDMSSTIVTLSCCQFIVGLGVSVWQSAGMQVMKVHFDNKNLPILNGIFLCANAVGSALIGMIISYSQILGLFDMNLIMMLCFFTLAILNFLTRSINNPPHTKSQDQQRLVTMYGNHYHLMKNWLVVPAIVSQTLPEVFNYVVLPLWAIPLMVFVMTLQSAKLLVMLSLIIYGAAGVVMGNLYHRYFSPMTWMSLQYLMSFMLLTLLLLTPNHMRGFWLYAIILSGISFFLGASNAYVSTYLANLFEAKYAGTIIGIYVYISQVLVGILAGLFGRLLHPDLQGNYDTASYDSALWYLVIILLLSAGICIILRKVRHHYPDVIKIKS